MRTLLQIGEIAQLLGVTPKTIRHYEKMGLLAQPERTRAGYRLYDAQDLLRLQRIRRLQALGLSLKKIRALLGEPEHQHTLWDVLQSLDKELAAQIQALEERRNKIRALPEDAPEVQQLVEDFVHYFEKYAFLPDLRKRVPQLENPFPQLLEELMMPLFSPGQIKVLNELARKISKEGNL